jgi:hypothetical protein
MRRSLIALTLVLLLAVPAVAQQQLNRYPGNIVTVAPTAVTIANSTTATSIFSTTIPRTFLEQFRQPYAGAGALHLKLLGTVTTSLFPGAANLGCNFGGTTATISLVNGATLTASLTAAPWFADVWVRAQGTGEVIYGNLELQTVAATTRVPFMTMATGTTSLTAAHTMACAWQWASASNTLVVNNATLVVGE